MQPSSSTRATIVSAENQSGATIVKATIFFCHYFIAWESNNAGEARGQSWDESLKSRWIPGGSFGYTSGTKWKHFAALSSPRPCWRWLQLQPSCGSPQWHENMNCCSSFNVHPIAEIIDQCSLEFTLSESCKVPDHSPLTLHNQPNCIYLPEFDPNELDSSVATGVSKRYQYHTMSPEFLKSDTWVAVLDTLLMRLEQMDPLQYDLDSLYEQMTPEIILEMDKYINYKDKAKSIRKRYKNYKPY